MKIKKYIISIILTVIIIGIICYISTPKNDYYKISTRVDKVKESKKQDEDGYKTKGWIIVQGTNIDLPVIALDKYEEFPVTKEKYSWTTNKGNKLENKMNILGHNVYNLSPIPKKKSKYYKRFEALMSFVYYDFAKENKYIQLTINDEDYLYKIFSASFIKGIDTDMFLKAKPTEKQLKKEIKMFTENSLYDYDIDVDSNDKIISLITCTRLFGRDSEDDFIVSGRLVRKGEKIDNYDMKKNKKNYAKLLKVWGDEVDEEEYT